VRVQGFLLRRIGGYGCQAGLQSVERARWFTAGKSVNDDDGVPRMEQREGKVESADPEVHCRNAYRKRPRRESSYGLDAESVVA
jgi:hypothetical protein